MYHDRASLSSLFQNGSKIENRTVVNVTKLAQITQNDNEWGDRQMI